MIAARLSLPHDDPTGLPGEPLFLQEVEWELARATRRGPGARSAGSGCLAYLEVSEPAQRRGQWGGREQGEIARQVALLLRADARRLEIAGRDAEGRFALLMPEQSADAARRRLEQLFRRVAAHRFTAGGERVRLTAAIGHAPFNSAAVAAQLRRQALAALDGARRPPAAQQAGRSWSAFEKAAQAPFPMLLALLVGLVFPFVLAVAWGTGGRLP